MPQLYLAQEVARPSYYDRIPIPAICAYSNALAPAGSTIRASYTPPYGQAAFMETFFLFTYKNAPAAANPFVQLYINFLPYTGGTYRVQQVQTSDNTPNVPYTQQSNSFGYLAYGDELQVVTFDGSTGGTQVYTAVLKGTEFTY